MSTTLVLERGPDGAYQLAPLAGNPDKSGQADMAQFKPFGLPVVDAALGGGIALIVSEIAQGFFTKEGEEPDSMKIALANGAAAFLVGKFGRKWLPEGAVNAAVMLLTFEAARQVVPIEDMVDKITSKIKSLTSKDTKKKTSDNKQDVPAAFSQSFHQTPALHRLALTNI